MLQENRKTLRQGRRCAVALAALAAASAAAVPAFGAELLFYSSVPRNLTESLVKGFQAKYPDIQVKVFQAGTETVLEKIELETKGRGYPDADAMWIQEQAAVGRLAARGLLESYAPAGHEFIDDKYKDPQGRWIGTFVTHVLLMYNVRAFQNQPPPKSWQELTETRFRNKITLANPRVSGTGAAVVSALVQNFGWGYIEKVAANKPQIASGHPAMVSTVIAGERTRSSRSPSCFRPRARSRCRRTPPSIRARTRKPTRKSSSITSCHRMAPPSCAPTACITRARMPSRPKAGPRSPTSRRLRSIGRCTKPKRRK